MSGAHAAVKAAFALVLLAAAVIHQATRARPSPLGVSRVVAVFGALNVVALLVACSRGVDLSVAFGAFAAPLLLVVTSAVCERQATRALALRALIAAALFAALLALFEVHIAELPWSHLRRPESTLINRNYLGHYLAVALPLVLSDEGLAKRPLARAAATALLVCILAITRCRAAWVALSVGLLFALAPIAKNALLRAKFFKRLPATAGGLLAGIALSQLPNRLAFHQSITASAARVLDYEQGTGAERLTQLRIAFRLAALAPLSGGGLGSWRDLVYQHPSLRSLIEGPVGTTPNSDIARALAEGGFPLALGLLALGAVVVRWAATPQLETTPPLDRAARISALVLVVLMVLDAPLFRPEMCVVAGALLAAMRSTRAPVALARKPTLALAAACLLACCAVASPP
jgi:hypothetical protein